MKKIFKALILLFVLVWISCQKDTSNTDLKELNKVEVITTDSVFVVEQLDSLRILTTINNKQNGNFDYNYEWKAYRTSTPINPKDDQIHILSNMSDLNVLMELAPGDYFLQYSIEDKASGIKTIKRYPLKVTGAFYEGWLVTNNKNDKAQLSFIRKDGQIFYDPISSMNTTVIKGKALKGFAAIIRSLSQLVFFTDQEVYRLDANNFTINGESEDLFMEKPLLKNPFYSLTNLNMDQFVLTNGAIHATTTPIWGAVGKYSDTFFGPSYDLFPFLIYGSKYNTVLYDSQNKRFLQTSYNSRSLDVFVGLPNNATFNVNQVNKDLIAVDRGMLGEFPMFMKDNTGYYYASIFPGRASPAGEMQAVKGTPDLDKLVAITASLQVKMVYYAADNKLYAYDILANQARLIFQFPTDVMIADMKILKSKGWDTVNDPAVNRRLVVAANGAGGGAVYYFNLSATGDVEGNKIDKQFDGFGAITQIDYRGANL